MLRFSRLSWLLAVCAIVVLGAAGARLVGPAHSASGIVATGAARILTTSDGRTLYLFTADKPNGKSSACTGECLTYWPPLMVPAGSTMAKTMAGVPGKFGELMLANGKGQLTYDGWPLYTFKKDKDSGDGYGQGVGGVWWAVVVGRGK